MCSKSESFERGVEKQQQQGKEKLCVVRENFYDDGVWGVGKDGCVDYYFHYKEPQVLRAIII